jgi:hypothetical protein
MGNLCDGFSMTEQTSKDREGGREVPSGGNSVSNSEEQAV